MTINGDGETAKNGGKHGDGSSKPGDSLTNKEKNGVETDTEVVFQKTVQGKLHQRQSGLDKYWTAVKNGASGVIAKVKEEKTSHKNSFEALSDEEKEWEEAEANCGENGEFLKEHDKEGKGRDIKDINVSEVSTMEHPEIAETLYTYYYKKRLGATRQAYFLLEERDAREQLIQLIHDNQTAEPEWNDELDDIEVDECKGKARNIRSIHIQEVEKMKHEDIAATMFVYNFELNSTVKKEYYYKMDEKKAKVELIQTISEIQKNDFLQKIERVIAEIKQLNISTVTKEMGESIIEEVCTMSEIKYIQSRSDATVRRKLYQYMEYIELIEEYLKDPIIMIPHNMFQLHYATDLQVVEADYFQLVFAVLVAKGSKNEEITQLPMRSLKRKALKLKRALQKLDNKSVSHGENGKSPKRTKVGNEVQEKANGRETNDSLTSKYLHNKQDMQEQDQNLIGMNIDDVIPKEETEGPNFSIPVTKKAIPVVEREKHEYMIHNKIHVTEKAKAQKIVQMVFRVLRKADPTVNIMPFTKGDSTQNDNLDQEEQIPEGEEDLKKWIDIATNQLRNKFVFSMRVSITETPDLVKNRIFDWCRAQRHYIEFKQLTSANIFFAGWLYRIHPKYHNRDDVRDWMADTNEVLKQDIHLAPSKVFKIIDEDTKKKIITDGLRVEVTFERKEAVLQALVSLEWENGPYSQSCFVPYRVNETYTDEMQENLIRLQKSYIATTKQTVFRMKAPNWVIKNNLENKYTTFKNWVQNSTVNDEKIVESLEVGNNDYVRLVYQASHSRGIQMLMRNLQRETERTFGKEVKNKLFSVNNAPITGSMAALEEKHAKRLQRVVNSSNPQNDDEDHIASTVVSQRKQSNKVYFGQVNETFADKVRSPSKKSGIDAKEEYNNEEKSEENKKEYKKELLDEVNQIIDQKMGKFEKKVNANIKRITDTQDKKIDQLQETVADNYKQSEKAAKRRNEEMQGHMQSQQLFMETLSKHFQLEIPDQKTKKPPVAMVEQGSHEGGSKK